MDDEFVDPSRRAAQILVRKYSARVVFCDGDLYLVTPYDPVGKDFIDAVNEIGWDMRLVASGVAMDDPVHQIQKQV